MDSVWTVPGYRHIRELGTGATGRVVMAEHMESGIQVAVKYLTPELALDPVFVARFRDEAQLLSELEDPHLVQFFEYVETSTQAAVVMELVDGVSLSQILAEGGPLAPEAALVVLKGSLLGLAAAHAFGLVHRDHKPGNVLVDGEGNSLLSDFCVAARASADLPSAGTPPYMPPEQWTGDTVTAAADVYAATAVCYECLTGRPPYEGRSLQELAAEHRGRPVPVENVPNALRDLVSAGLAKDVRGRPQSAFAYLLELEMTAGAAYGADWEDTGRAQLKARAHSLALLFPVTRPQYGSATGPATEVLTTAAEMPLDASPETLLLPSPESEKYRPSARMGLVGTAAGAVMAMFVTGALLMANVGADPVVQQAGPASQVSPTAQTGGELPTGDPDAARPVKDQPSRTVTTPSASDEPTSDTPSSTAPPSTAPPQTDKPDKPDPEPSETDSPEPDPTDDDEPTEKPTDPGTPSDPPDPEEPSDPPTDPADPTDPTDPPAEDPTPSKPAAPEPDEATTSKAPTSPASSAARSNGGVLAQ